MFCGRIHPTKGVGLAIEAAMKLKKKLLLVGSIGYSHMDYFNNEIKPYINGDVSLVENISEKTSIAKLYGSSKLFIFPIQYEEPFGLVMIEAMATGTPVVAFARGSVPEVVKDGETGFIVNPSDDDIRGDWVIKKTGLEGLCEAVEKIYTMPEDQYRAMRRACRTHVEANFTVERMVDGYEKVYQEVLSKKH